MPCNGVGLNPRGPMNIFDKVGPAGITRSGARGPLIIPLFGKQPFGFSFMGASQALKIVVKRALPVTPFYHYTLLVRVHELEIADPDSEISVVAKTTLPSREDPREFTAIPGGLNVTVTNLYAAGTLLFDAKDNLGPFLRVTIEAVQTTANQALYAELSAVLYGRVP